jgi:hypothetical protein
MANLAWGVLRLPLALVSLAIGAWLLSTIGDSAAADGHASRLTAIEATYSRVGYHQPATTDAQNQAEGIWSNIRSGGQAYVEAQFASNWTTTMPVAQAIVGTVSSLYC